MERGIPAERMVRLLQVASPALPIGGYSYSTGLETAIEAGRVSDAESAFAWIADALQLVLGRFDAPLLAAAAAACATQDRAGLIRLNRLALAARETAELRLECEQAGFSLVRWIADVAGPEARARDAVRAACGDDAVAAEVVSAEVVSAEVVSAEVVSAEVVSAEVIAADVVADLAEAVGPPVASAVGWALVCASLGLSPRDAVTAFLWSFAENQAAVLLKAVPLGQAQAQRVLLRLGPVVAAAAAAAVDLPPERWSNAAPGLAIASMRHETQYSRLFRS